MIAPDLLPPSSTAFERAFSLATDTHARLAAGVTFMRGIKLAPPPDFVPFLIYEYGLGELSPYVPNIGDLIALGIDWERVRGTPEALRIALAWLGYVPALEEFPTHRRRWTHFQVGLDRVRATEADLPRIEGVGQLSVAVRSVFWRGYHGHDVRALEFGRSAWGDTLFAAYSGVRVDGGKVKWSFGRAHEIDHTMTEAELTALGVWSAPSGSGKLGWGSFSWAPAPWGASEDLTRSRDMAEDTLLRGPVWAIFRDATDAVIGYRRARVARPVKAAVGGVYRIGGSAYAPEAPGLATLLYVEALTAFGDGFGATAAKVGFVLGAAPVDPARPGQAWASAGEIESATPIIAEEPVTIEFGRTIRERIAAILRF